MTLRARAVALASLPLLLTAAAHAQSYQNAPARIPANAGSTENVDFADVDLDGDRDAALAEGGDAGNDRNKLWINRGGEPGGTLGYFADRTAAQFPAVLDQSRDMDFVDVDHDGDMDVYVSNTSAISSQSNRFWINMGGAQGGSAGFFTDQSAARWVDIAVNNGTTSLSSIAPSIKLASGGFIDWSCDCVFGDLDSDGDMDLYHSTYGGVFGGGVPSRIFLNDGAGAYREFNPSAAQLTGSNILNGTPALWCEGNQNHNSTATDGSTADIADTPLGVELGDFDGDLDVDVLQGARNETPRLYRNRLTDTGGFVRFRDATFASGYPPQVTGGGNYEQDVGDLDDDGDLDIYGLNWPGLCDATLRNDGAGVFGSPFQLANSCPDDNEADFVDYDADGDLDVFVCNFSGQDRLYRNDGAPNWQFSDVTGTSVPSYSLTGLGADGCDIDHDGDYDILVANDNDQPEVLLLNVGQVPDTRAPRLEHLEQLGVAAGARPVRVHVYDNSSWDVARYDAVELEYSANGGGNWSTAPMHHSGGQLFRGEIPASVPGVVQYRVRATDEHGNVALSATKTSGSSCPTPVSYCTAGTSTAGCTPAMASAGVPQAGASSGFTLSATGVEGQRQGLIFYGVNGRHVSVWNLGSTSFLCVKTPVQRTSVASSGGAAGTCSGLIALDWSAWTAANPGALGSPFSAGALVNAQAWYRDPSASGTTNLSNAIEFSVCP